jgi:hypothetical protein
MRRFLLLSLAVCGPLVGCSTTRQAHLPGDLPPDREDAAGLRVVAKGQAVTVWLKSGEKVNGEVLEADPHRLVLGRPGNYGYREDIYPAAEIARIEASYATGFGNAVGGVVGAVVLTFMALIILLAIFPPDFGGLS